MDEPPKPPRAKPGRKKGQRHVTDQRVQQLATLIATGQYITHVTAQHLAIEWGVQPNTVEKLACEAARRVRGKVFDDDVLIARAKANLEYITALAVDRKELRVAVEAIKATMGIVRESATQEAARGAAGLGPPVQHLVVTEEYPVDDDDAASADSGGVESDGAPAEGASVPAAPPGADPGVPGPPAGK